MSEYLGKNGVRSGSIPFVKEKRPRKPLFSWRGLCITTDKSQTKIKSVVVRCTFSWYLGAVPSLLTLVLTLDVYDNHINRRAIDSMFRWENPRIQFQGR